MCVHVLPIVVSTALASSPFLGASQGAGLLLIHYLKGHLSGPASPLRATAVPVLHISPRQLKRGLPLWWPPAGRTPCSKVLGDVAKLFLLTAGS